MNQAMIMGPSGDLPRSAMRSGQCSMIEDENDGRGRGRKRTRKNGARWRREAL